MAVLDINFDVTGQALVWPYWTLHLVSQALVLAVIDVGSDVTGFGLAVLDIRFHARGSGLTCGPMFEQLINE